ncbi:pleckstrin homology domain-containing family M member 1 [Tribolium madens]|uniref:pleckstrin homology domain-containing family M member 1 n=1 Tax=Tribolium madens TaxID=41895 RepID=UPI001CF736D1|nr:pleckstrin homology domain-containing family M member 1 [Tribolium madens]
MNKLFKSVHSSDTNKDNLIKKSITDHLSNSVKAIQYCGVEENGLNKEDVTEASNTLCMTIEAIFLHGLRDSLSKRFKRAIADVDERPEPSFWAPLLVISHRQIIDQITHLSQITSEVGQCRAWIRLALNDCLLSSYLMTIRRDPSSLKSFYRPTAYLRDSDLVDVAQRLIEGVEAFKTVTLPCNSSLLNTWQLPSLFLAGIWAPTLKACPVAPCDDVAQMVEETRTVPESNSETCSLSSAMSITSQNSGLKQMVALNEDEALKIILAKHRDKIEINKSEENLKSSLSESTDSENLYTVGNSLNRRTGWSFDDSQPQEEIEEAAANPTKEIPPVINPEPKSMEGSFNALIESYNMLSGGYIKTPDLREVWQKFEDHNIGEMDTPNNNNVGQSSVLLAKSETPLSTLIGRISKEKGLDRQNYECAGCREALGVTIKPKVCAFTAEYFCDSCMSEEEISIPARIIHNWDFKSYPVSQKAFNYINEIKDHPTIDFKTLNPYIYGVVEEMAQLQILRNQLNFLRAYLYTCREPVIEQLQKQMWPREYMYEHVHQYSVSDLAEISSGVLAQHLQTVVNFGKEHVIACWLCSQKGFVCEVCNKPKALFPFDVEHIYRCDVCNAVYHKGCLNSTKPCPKCKRRKERADLPLLGATVE